MTWSCSYSTQVDSVTLPTLMNHKQAESSCWSDDREGGD